MNLQRLCPHYFCSQCAKRTASLVVSDSCHGLSSQVIDRGPMFPRVCIHLESAQNRCKLIQGKKNWTNLK